jgi:hypothetical protein
MFGQLRQLLKKKFEKLTKEKEERSEKPVKEQVNKIFLICN